MRRIFGIGLAAVLIGAGVAAATWGWIQWRYDRLVVTDFALRPTCRSRSSSARASAPTAGSARCWPIGWTPPSRFTRRQSTQAAGQRRQPLRRLRRAGAHVRLRRGTRRAASRRGARLRRPPHLRHLLPGQGHLRRGRALLVTQRFHLPRAIFTCRNLGVDGIGFSADRRPYWSNTYYRLRDAFATLRAWWDVKIARPLPVLGPREEMGLEAGS